MLFRNIFDFIFSSPVTIVASVVSVTCAGILIVSITSNMQSSITTDNASSRPVGGNLNNDGSSDLYEGVISGSRSHRESNAHNKTTPLISEQGGGVSPANSSYNMSQETASASRSVPSSKREHVNGNITPAKHADFSNHREKNLSEVRPVQSTTINDSFANSSPNSLDFSGAETTNISTTNAINTNATGLTNNGSAVTSETNSGANNNSDAEASITGKDFPVSKENEVKISIDETHYISCQPIEVNGPPCMCTYTVVDADGSSSRTEDNCG